MPCAFAAGTTGRISISGAERDLVSRFTSFVNDVGSDSVPTQTGASADSSVDLTPHDYFLASRIDGASTVRALRSISGMGEEEFAEAFVKLLAAGLARVEGVERIIALDVYLSEKMGEPPGGSAQSARGGVGASSFSNSSSFTTPGTGSSSFSNSSSFTAPGTGSRAFSRDGSSVRETPAERSRSAAASRGRETYTATPKRASSRTRAPSPKLGQEIVPPGWPIPFSQFTFDPDAMASGSALDAEQKQVILYYHYHLRRVTYYALFGLTRSASRTEIKQAYFGLSKAFHPDRWYRKDTGVFGERLEDVFKWLNRAYGVLSSPKKRKGYDKLLDRGFIGEWQLERSQAGREPSSVRKSTVEPAPDPEARKSSQMLEIRARHAATGGRWEEATDLYTRAVQLAPTADLRIRLVECMLKANVAPPEIDRQIEAARRAGADPKSVALFEAEVARRSGQLDRAEACFRFVLETEPNNPVARLGLEKLGRQ